MNTATQPQSEKVQPEYPTRRELLEIMLEMASIAESWIPRLRPEQAPAAETKQPASPSPAFPDADAVFKATLESWKKHGSRFLWTQDNYRRPGRVENSATLDALSWPHVNFMRPEFSHWSALPIRENPLSLPPSKLDAPDGYVLVSDRSQPVMVGWLWSNGCGWTEIESVRPGNEQQHADMVYARRETFLESLRKENMSLLSPRLTFTPKLPLSPDPLSHFVVALNDTTSLKNQVDSLAGQLAECKGKLNAEISQHRITHKQLEDAKSSINNQESTIRQQMRDIGMLQNRLKNVSAVADGRATA